MNMHGCAVITIVGVGQWGCKALNELASDVVSMTRVVAVDTDPLALATCQARTLVLVEEDWATWVMSSADPCSGHGRVQAAIAGADMVLLLGDPCDVGLPGLFDELSRLCFAKGIVTVPVCPYSPLIPDGHGSVNCLIPVESLPRPMTLLLDVAKGGDGLAPIICQAIASVILTTSMVGVDFADVRTVLDEPGFALASIGVGEGHNRAQYAAVAALNEAPDFSRLLPTARALLAVIMVNDEVGLDEFTTVGDWISRYVSADATLAIGIVTDPSLARSEMRLLLLAGGIENMSPLAVPYFQR